MCRYFIQLEFQKKEFSSGNISRILFCDFTVHFLFILHRWIGFIGITNAFLSGKGIHIVVYFHNAIQLDKSNSNKTNKTGREINQLNWSFQGEKCHKWNGNIHKYYQRYTWEILLSFCFISLIKTFFSSW